MEIENAKTKKGEDQKWNMETWRIRGVGREREPLPGRGLFGRFGGFDVSSKHLSIHQDAQDLGGFTIGIRRAMACRHFGSRVKCRRLSATFVDLHRFKDFLKCP